MKGNLKRIYNCKKLWIICLCLIQILFVTANIFYYFRTNYCCDIHITSPTDCDVSFVTPMGKTYIQNVKANITFIEYKRPLAKVLASKCATITYSSNRVSVLDIISFTMKKKRLFWLWLGLTYISVLLIIKSNKKENYN